MKQGETQSLINLESVMKRTNKKAARVMKLAHQIKRPFNNFSVALKAAWMWLNSGKIYVNEQNNPDGFKSAVIAYWCDRELRAKREADALAKSKKAQARKTAQKLVNKNHSALKANQEKMKQFRNPANKKPAHVTDTTGFYNSNRNWSDAEMDLYL